MSIELKGADQLATLAKALKDAGDKELQKELNRAINRSLKPLRADLKDSARATLPRSGGLAAAVAASKIRSRKRTSSRTTGVRLVGLSNMSLWHLDQGIIRHRRKGLPPALWTQQKTVPGWWTKPTEAAAPEIRVELLAAMGEVARKLKAK